MTRYDKVTRRSVVLSAAASAGLAALNPSTPSAEGKSSTDSERLALATPEVDGGRLVNESRAREMMARFDLQALVALDPINVYYLTNVDTVARKFRSQFAGLASYAASPDAPTYLISSLAEGFGIANGDRATASLMPHGFASPGAMERDEHGTFIEPEGSEFRIYHVRDDVSLTERERRWRNMQDTLGADVAANRAWALARALKAQGVTSGRIAVDDMRIAQFLSQTDLGHIECVDAYGLFQLIRMVKSKQELAYQSLGGRNNGEACLATVRQIEVGMTELDIEQIFRLECAKRGNDLSGLVVGMPTGGLPDGAIVAGKPYLIDCVSHYRHYHGDTARTFVVGEPSQLSRERFRANAIAREAVFDALRPGTKFSELRRIGFDTMKKFGIPEHAIFVTPHTVGLQHGDSPRSIPHLGVDAMDHVLEEDMVLTVDLPFVEVGWGTGHNEDLVRITKNGHELMNPDDDPYIVL